MKQMLAVLGLAILAPLSAHAVYDESVPHGYVDALVKKSPEQYFAEMNRGWFDEQYAPLKAKLEPHRSYIVLHNRLPSTPLNLRTPNEFRESVVESGLFNLGKLDIGHVMLGWRCEINGQTFEGDTAISGEQTNQQMAMALGGWGLTGIFSIFTDGHLQTPILTRSVFHLAKKNARPIATLAFEVEPEECGQMLQFLQTFLAKPNQPFRRFGLNADPLKFEGGGCGSFATSTISTSGIIDEFFPHLWRTMHANPKAFGFGLDNLPPGIDPYPVPHRPGERRKVNALNDLFLKNWDDNSDNALSIRVMDPELLFLAQETIFRQALDDLYRDNLAFARAFLKTPFVRPRQVAGRSGNGPLIDRGFDANAAATVTGAKSWFRKMKARGLRARGFNFNGEPAVLFTR